MKTRPRFRALGLLFTALVISCSVVMAAPMDEAVYDRMVQSLAHALNRAAPNDLHAFLVPRIVAQLEPEDQAELMKHLIERDDPTSLTLALRAGLDPNQTITIVREGEPLSFTALNYALTVQGERAVADALIGAGADINLRSIDDTPPLLTATVLGNTWMVARLLAQGADPNCSDRIIGVTPLMAALSNTADPAKAVSLARRLVAHGARMDTATITGHTALSVAASAKNEAAVEWLMQHDTDASSSVQDASVIDESLDDAPRGRDPAATGPEAGRR